MNIQPNDGQRFALAFAATWNRLERSLDSSVSAIRGISLAEYRLLRALAEAPAARASRVDLAQAVGLTPSGVTRALRPLEKLGVVTTIKSERDARLAMATLTPAGQQLVQDVSGVIDDTMSTILERSPRLSTKLASMTALLEDLGR